MMTAKLAETLRFSSFGTISEVQRFIEWYEQVEHVSDWDKERNRQANEIIRLADEEGLL